MGHKNCYSNNLQMARVLLGKIAIKVLNTAVSGLSYFPEREEYRDSIYAGTSALSAQNIMRAELALDCFVLRPYSGLITFIIIDLSAFYFSSSSCKFGSSCPLSSHFHTTLND